jgi:hypothetical protein
MLFFSKKNYVFVPNFCVARFTFLPTLLLAQIYRLEDYAGRKHELYLNLLNLWTLSMVCTEQ